MIDSTPWYKNYINDKHKYYFKSKYGLHGIGFWEHINSNSLEKSHYMEIPDTELLKVDLISLKIELDDWNELLQFAFTIQFIDKEKYEKEGIITNEFMLRSYLDLKQKKNEFQILRVGTYPVVLNQWLTDHRFHKVIDDPEIDSEFITIQKQKKKA